MMPELRVLSLGAGVQSSTLALMAAAGEIARPDVAIFADTGDEKRGTYRHLTWLAEQLPFPLCRVNRFRRTLSEMTLARYAGVPGTKAFTPPFFFHGGMLPKQCSKEFKTRAITREIRRMIELRPKHRGPSEPIVEVMLGISKDESHRMKPSEVPWIEHKYPLIDLRMTRGDCVRWLERHGFDTPPRSACVFCPFQSQEEFDDMKRNPLDDDFERAVAFDEAIRHGGGGSDGPFFVSDQRRPLGEIQFDRQHRLDLWGNECEGHCGV
jgi:hypothetical protein